MKRLDKAILIHDMIEEFKKMLQKLLNKMDIKDYFRFGLDTGYTVEPCGMSPLQDPELLKIVQMKVEIDKLSKDTYKIP